MIGRRSDSRERKEARWSKLKTDQCMKNLWNIGWILIVLLALNRIASLKLTKNSHPPGTTAQKDRAVDVSGSKLAPPRPEFLEFSITLALFSFSYEISCLIVRAKRHGEHPLLFAYCFSVCLPSPLSISRL